MKQLFIFFLFFFSSLSSLLTPLDWEERAVKTEEEALFLRRISDFWQEEDYVTAQLQMETFLNLFPWSSFVPPITVSLGDLAIRHQDYPAALKYYDSVTEESLKEKCFFNRMQSLYQLQRFTTIQMACEEKLKTSLDETAYLNTLHYLAISLYCQSILTEDTTVEKPTEQAKVCLEELFLKAPSQNTGEALAHLYCLTNESEKASQIYLALGNKNPSIQEEMQFQAACLQSNIHPERSLAIFKELYTNETSHKKDAAYNYLVLSFENKNYEALLSEKERLHSLLAPEHTPLLRLLVGKSHFALTQYEEALEVLKSLLSLDHPPLFLDSLLSPFIEAAFAIKNIDFLNQGIAWLTTLNPDHENLPKALFLRASLFKEAHEHQLALDAFHSLAAQYPTQSVIAEVKGEILQLEGMLGRWEDCYLSCNHFLDTFPGHFLEPLVWQHLLHSAFQKSQHSGEEKLQFAQDIQRFLNSSCNVSSKEKNAWQFRLAETFYSLESFDNAISCLNELLHAQENGSLSEEANGLMLLALCHQKKQDLVSFCHLSEQALLKQQTFIPNGLLHIQLFNAYLDQNLANSLDLAVQHLFAAFLLDYPIEPCNLVWLGQQLNEKNCTDDARLVYATLLDTKKTSIQDPYLLEEATYQLAALYEKQNMRSEEICLLEQWFDPEQPPQSWNKQNEMRSLLANAYLFLKDEEKALPWLQLIEQELSPRQSYLSAESHLNAIKIQLKKISEFSYDHPDTIQLLSRLKNLVLQKTLAHEPIHLEAALEYVSFKTTLQKLSPDKTKALLLKTLNDFENSEDLFSLEYQKARVRFPEKNSLYEAYRSFIQAKIDCLEALLSSDPEEQKQLQAKAKQVFLQIMENNLHVMLVHRAALSLKEFDAPPDMLPQLITPEE